MLKIVGKAVSMLMVGMQAILGTYYLIASPPLFLFYPELQDLQSPSVYVPGAGFSGFWYHLGYFYERLGDDSGNVSYYCYSSGCLSLALATLHATNNNNRTHHRGSLLQDTYRAARSVQDSLLRGQVHRYDTVSTFLNNEQHNLVPHHIDPDRLDKLHILVTDLTSSSSLSTGGDSGGSSKGVVVKRPRNRTELVEALTQTTHIPWITGPWRWDGVDGGFSRRLHTPCDDRIDVPWNRDTVLHFLNPGALTQKAVYQLFASGRRDAKKAAMMAVEETATNDPFLQDHTQVVHDNSFFHATL